MARIFVSGAVSITITEQRAPALRAANATPCAALPALTVQTPSLQLRRRQLADDVVGAANLEGADRLQRFELEIELRRAAVRGVRQLEANQRRADGRVVDGAGGVADRRQRDVTGGNVGGQESRS